MKDIYNLAHNLVDLNEMCEKRDIHWNTRDGVKMKVNDMTDSHVFYARRMLLKQFSALSPKRQSMYKYFEEKGIRISFKALILLISEQMIEERKKRMKMIAKREADSLFAKAIEEELNDENWDQDPYYEDVPNIM